AVPAKGSTTAIADSIMAATAGLTDPFENLRPLRTGFLFDQDKNLTFTHQYATRFDNIQTLAAKRPPALKPIFINQTGANPKHLTLLRDHKISIDAPMTPMEVATVRAKRIEAQQLLQREK